MSLSSGQKLLLGGAVLAGAGYLFYRHQRSAAAATLPPPANLTPATDPGPIYPPPLVQKLPANAFAYSIQSRNTDGTGEDLYWTPAPSDRILKDASQGLYRLTSGMPTVGTAGYAILTFHNNIVTGSGSSASSNDRPVPVVVTDYDFDKHLVTVRTTKGISGAVANDDVKRLPIPSGITFQIPYDDFVVSVGEGMLQSTTYTP